MEAQETFRVYQQEKISRIAKAVDAKRPQIRQERISGVYYQPGRRESADAEIPVLTDAERLRIRQGIISRVNVELRKKDIASAERMLRCLEHECSKRKQVCEACG